jgi:asparagine synthase (glutamine-hydrolysing)
VGQPLDELAMLAWVSDEPVADPATYSQLCVAAAAAQRVKVLLSGAGGDELFGGYSSYKPAWKYAAFITLPPQMKKLLYRLGASGWIEPRGLEAMLDYPKTRLPWHFWAMCNLSQSGLDLVRLLHPESRDPRATMRQAFDRYRHLDGASQQMLADLHTYLPDQVLPMMDRATMACSIEGRVPFLDVPLVEFAFSLDGATKLGTPVMIKRLLKQAISSWVPDSIIRRKKIGMPSPFRELIAREHAGLVRAVLLAPDSYVRSVLPARWIESMLASHRRATESFRVLYALLILEVWHKLFIRERAYSRPSGKIRDLLAISSRNTA